MEREDGRMCSFRDLTDRSTEKDLNFHLVKVKGPGLNLTQVSQWVVEHTL